MKEQSFPCKIKFPEMRNTKKCRGEKGGRGRNLEASCFCFVYKPIFHLSQHCVVQLSAFWLLCLLPLPGSPFLPSGSPVFSLPGSPILILSSSLEISTSSQWSLRSFHTLYLQALLCLSLYGCTLLSFLTVPPLALFSSLFLFSTSSLHTTAQK